QLAGLPRASWSHEITAALRIVDLSDRADDLVGTFSKGMQQRLGIGVALLGSPELILLDEPTSALDPVGRQDVRRIIHDLRERGPAVCLNSPLLGEVDRVCDRVAIVDQGRVVAAATIDDLLAVRAVRVHATGLTADALQGLQEFATLTRDGDWLTAAGLPPE